MSGDANVHITPEGQILVGDFSAFRIVEETPMSAQPSITEFLTQRWDEQERQLELIRQSHGAVSGAFKLFVAEFGPAYVLADIAAKRRIRALHEAAYDRDEDILSCGQCGCPQSTAWPCPTVRLLAAPFSQHQAFDPEWSVSE